MSWLPRARGLAEVAKGKLTGYAISRTVLWTLLGQGPWDGGSLLLTHRQKQEDKPGEEQFSMASMSLSRQLLVNPVSQVHSPPQHSE